MKTTWPKKISILLLSMSLLSLIVWGLIPKPQRVEAVVIKKEPFTQVINEDGQTQAKDSYIVSAPVTGQLLRLKFKAGDDVKKGQRLFSMQPKASELLDKRAALIAKEHIGAATSDLLKAKVMEERAKFDYQTALTDDARMQKLAAKGFASDSEIEHQSLKVKLKKKLYESAKHSVINTKHKLEQAKLALEYVKQGKLISDNKHMIHILAPVSGHIIKVKEKSTRTITMGVPIVEISSLSDIEIMLDVLSNEAVKIPKKAKVIINHWGGEKPLRGIVRRIEPGGYTKVSALGVEEQRVNVLIDIISKHKLWKSLGVGFHVDCDIIIYENRDALTLPLSALFRIGNDWAVYKITNGKAKLTHVTIGRRNFKKAIVLGGIKANDLVINYPSDKIKNTTRVTLKK
jgi:HlyD family secretion protein